MSRRDAQAGCPRAGENHRGLKTKLGKLARSERGTMTLEFAFIAPMLLALIMGIIEFGLLALRVTTLDGAVSSASRAIYTGGVVTREGLEEMICDELTLFSDCRNDIRLQAIELQGFDENPSNVSIECADSTNLNFQPASTFQTGSGGSIILVRVCATVDLILPYWGLGTFIEKTEGGRAQIVSSLAFKNEPF